MIKRLIFIALFLLTLVGAAYFAFTNQDLAKGSFATANLYIQNTPLPILSPTASDAIVVVGSTNKPTQYIITILPVNIRSKPDFTSPIVKELPVGSILVLRDISIPSPDRVYGKVLYQNDQIGYISLFYYPVGYTTSWNIPLP